MNPWRAALDQALLLQKQPALAVAFQQASLPEGMPTLIRLASDEGGRRKDLAQLVGIDESQLQSAATEYLLQICLYPGSNDYRVLGLNATADMKVAKEHHRLLLKWLHPDRNPDNQILAGRVNQAWSAIKNNLNVAVLNPLPSDTTIDWSQQQVQPPAGRFPLFLWGLIAFVVLLLVFSMMPDSTIYVADSDSIAKRSEAMGTKSADSNDSLLAKKLSALEFSFGAIKKAVLPSDKVKKKPLKESESVSNLQLQHKPLPTLLERESIVSSPTKTNEKNALKAHQQVSNSSMVQVAKPEANADKPIITNSTKQAVPVLEPKQTLQSEAQALLDAFRQDYRAGNLNAFMLNFSNFARNNRGNRQAIEEDYAGFFAKSSARKISFTDEKWLYREDVVQFTARYSATVRRKGDLISDTSKGNIEFIMSKENGKLLIQQILLND